MKTPKTKTEVLCIAVVTMAVLCGCGVETAGTAATAAAVKKQELEQGQKTLEQVQQKIDQTMQQVQQAPARNGTE